MSSRVTFRTGPFKGIDIHDAFARAALAQTPVVVDVGPIPWPQGFAPIQVQLGDYKTGETITAALKATADVLIVLYTDLETEAFLDVFTANADWSVARKSTWNGYAHNFAKFKSIISGIDGDAALEQGIFGYLSAIIVGGKNVVLYKSELHPKQNGNRLPFVPVIAQLIAELSPSLVISTGTAGAIGAALNCGDVAITTDARFKCQVTYPDYPQIDAMSASHAKMSSSWVVKTERINYAAENFTVLAVAGLKRCHSNLQALSGFDFVKDTMAAPGIFVTDLSPVPGPEPMTILSADYLTVDDVNDAEGLQSLGIMNDTDDAFVFYAIGTLTGVKPAWVSVRNASEPQIAAKPFPPGTSATVIIDDLKATAGTIYGIYQYCTTLCSAFACWGIVAGL